MGLSSEGSTRPSRASRSASTPSLFESFSAIRRTRRGFATIAAWPRRVTARLTQSEWIPTSSTSRLGGNRCEPHRQRRFRRPHPERLHDLARTIPHSALREPIPEVEPDRQAAVRRDTLAHASLPIGTRFSGEPAVFADLHGAAFRGLCIQGTGLLIPSPWTALRGIADFCVLPRAVITEHVDRAGGNWLIVSVRALKRWGLLRCQISSPTTQKRTRLPRSTVFSMRSNLSRPILMRSFVWCRVY